MAAGVSGMILPQISQNNFSYYVCTVSLSQGLELDSVLVVQFRAR